MPVPIKSSMTSRLSAAAVLLLSSSAAHSVLPIAAGEQAREVVFETQISPALNDNCLACHCKTTTKGGLNLETRELMLKGGDTGPALVPGDPQKSLLFTAASHADPDTAMPPRDNKAKAKNLTPSQLSLLKDWILQGAKIPPRAEKNLSFQPLPEHLKGIVAVALTPDGQYAACARANRVFVYHLPTGACVLQELAHRDQVSSLAFSPDGMSLASGSFREIKIWRRDPEKTVPAGSVPTPEDRALAAGSLQFGAVQGASVVVSDVGGMPRFTLQHGADVIATAMSRDAKRFATAGKDGTLKLWDDSGKALATMKGNRLLSEATGAQERALQVETANVATAKTAVTDAEKFVEASKERLRKADNEAKVKQDAVSEKEGALKKLKDAKEAGTNPPPADAALTAAEEALQKALKAAETAKTEATLSKAESEKAVLDVQEAKTRLAAAEDARKAAEDLLSAARKRAEAAVAPLEKLVFSPDGLYVAGRDSNGVVYTWAARNGMAVSVLGNAVPSVAGKPLRFVSDGILCSGEGEASVLWDIRSPWKQALSIGASSGKSPFADRVCALAFSPDSRLLASGGGEPSRDGELFVWDAASGNLVKEIKRAHVDTVLALEFSPDGKSLLTGSADRMARQIEVSQGTILKTFEGHTGHVLAVGWSLDGRQVATAGADNVAKVWAVDTGLRKRNIEGYDKEVTGVRFLGASADVVTCSGDNKVRAVGADGKEIRVFLEPGEFLQGLAVRRDATRAVAGGNDGVLREWAIESGKVESRFLP